MPSVWACACLIWGVWRWSSACVHTSLRCEEYDAAIADAKHCITLLGHDNFNLSALLSSAALEAKRIPEALEWSTRTLELAPHNAVALRTRGKCLSIMGRYAEAYADFKRAFALTDHCDGYAAITHNRIATQHILPGWRLTDASVAPQMLMHYSGSACSFL